MALARNTKSSSTTNIRFVPKSITTSGQIRPLTNNSYNAIINSSTIAVLTLTMPANPVKDDFVEIKFTNPITSLSIISANVIYIPKTTVLTGDYLKLVFDGINTWY